MEEFHKGLDTIGGEKVLETMNYSKSLNGLPKSDVQRFMLEGNCSVVVRPSKSYLCAWFRLLEHNISQSE